MRKLVTLMIVGLLALPMLGQRYATEIFSDVTRTDTIPYGVNKTIITGMPMDQTMIFDLYEPDGDTATDRALMLVAHTGNFLPAIRNGSPNGTIKDSTVVEICTRLAKQGYVVASFDNRTGWDAQNADQAIQTAQLLQAAYRGIQDARTCVRYFRKSVAEDNNPHGINPDKIGILGVGTGGYISLGTAYLNDHASEIQLVKFTDPGSGASYIDTTLHGNMWGTNTTPLNTPNHVGYSSHVSVAVNIGGALGDSVWLDAGEVPAINFHTPQDPNAPFDVGIVIVPTTGNTVIDLAAGSNAVARMNNRFGNNDVFVNAGINDAWTTAANTGNSGNEGLFAFDKPFDASQLYNCAPIMQMLPYIPEGSPWDWWNEADFIAKWDFAVGTPPGVAVNCNQRRSNPDMSPMKGRTYIDSIMGYASPRLVAAMALYPVGIEELQIKSNLQLFPNPANELLVLNTSTQMPMLNIQIMDAMGRVVRNVSGLRVSNYRIDREGLTSGIYFVKVGFEEGSLTRRVIFE
ncbi:MAG: T9SS type A sorting domain-containing protein [Bacteroidia bacterium]